MFLTPTQALRNGSSVCLFALRGTATADGEPASVTDEKPARNSAGPGGPVDSGLPSSPPPCFEMTGEDYADGLALFHPPAHEPASEWFHPYSSSQNVSTGDIPMFLDRRTHNPCHSGTDSAWNEATTGRAPLMKTTRCQQPFRSARRRSGSSRLSGLLWSFWFTWFDERERQDRSAHQIDSL